MIDDRNEYEKTRACLKANHVSSDNRVSNDHRHAINASSLLKGGFFICTIFLY